MGYDTLGRLSIVILTHFQDTLIPLQLLEVIGIPLG